MDSLLIKLRNNIEREILPLIDSNYILYGLPFYSNIGDVLIWEGTRQLLEKTSYKCVGSYASGTTIREKLSPDTIIIIIGGGFFGDVWRRSFSMVLSNIEGRTQNKIIFLPNSISYKSDDLLINDVSFLSTFKRLYICCRDLASYDLAKGIFTNKVLLVPDMALYIAPDTLKEYLVPCKKGTLYIQRKDHESNASVTFNNVDIHDWPTMERLMPSMFFYKSIFRIYIYMSNFLFFNSSSLRNFVNYVGLHFFKRYMLKTGVSFISNYNTIVTTRLHPMILAYLLNRKVLFVDNSYGKIEHLYETWLKKVESISKYHQNKI